MKKNIDALIGFTLIEFTIIILILTFFFLQGLSLLNSIDDRNLERVTNEIYSVLESSKKKATSVEKNNQYCTESNQKIIAYGLGLDNNVFSLCIYCNNFPSQCNPLFSKTVSPRYLINTPDNSKDIKFSLLTGYTTENFLIVKDKITNRCIKIQISTIGMLEKGELYNCQ